MLKYAHLFYDGDGNPLSKENILEAESMAEYSINDEPVTIEEFNNELEKYVVNSMTDMG